MQTCPNMQRLIMRLAARFGMDLEAEEAHLKLANGGYFPLVVEKVGKHLLSVAHYQDLAGEVVRGTFIPDLSELFAQANRTDGWAAAFEGEMLVLETEEKAAPSAPDTPPAPAVRIAVAPPPEKAVQLSFLDLIVEN